MGIHRKIGRYVPPAVKAGSASLRVIGLSLAAFLISPLVLPMSAFAQDAQTKQTSTVSEPSEGLALNIGTNTDLGFENSAPLLDLPASSVGSTLFKLDISDPNCLSGVGQCLRRDDRVDLGLSKQFTSVSETGIDVSVTPRAAMRIDNENASTLVGAVVEIGEDLRKGSEFKNNTWYVFAGADAESVTYGPNTINRLTNGQFHLQDQIFVGDAQAGVGYRMGDADVSLSYTRREATSEDFKFSEDAAALSFTWKR